MNRHPDPWTNQGRDNPECLDATRVVLLNLWPVLVVFLLMLVFTVDQWADPVIEFLATFNWPFA